MNIQKIPVSRLNAAAYNPRKDLKPGDREYEKLKRSISEFGYVEPVIWNRQTGNVVGGHQRLKAGHGELRRAHKNDAHYFSSCCSSRASNSSVV